MRTHVDMQTGERLIPWDPIPQASNVYLSVGVCRVEEFPNVEGMPVAVIVTAARRDGGDGAWQLLFQHVTAYRREPVGAHANAHLIALRETLKQQSLPTPATYEVVRSQWLREAISPYYAHPHAVHHFVIVDSEVAYDVAAEWCDTRMLDDAEQASADRRPDQ